MSKEHEYNDEMRRQDEASVDAALKVLGEHFDTVQIFVTRHEPTEGGTINHTKGQGNWFARMGYVQMWLEAESEQTRINTRKKNEQQS